METWQEIKARHKREKIELVQSFASHYTIKDTAKDIKSVTSLCLDALRTTSDIKFLKSKVA